MPFFLPHHSIFFLFLKYIFLIFQIQLAYTIRYVFQPLCDSLNIYAISWTLVFFLICNMQFRQTSSILQPLSFETIVFRFCVPKI